MTFFFDALSTPSLETRGGSVGDSHTCSTESDGQWWFMNRNTPQLNVCISLVPTSINRMYIIFYRCY